MNPGKSRKRGRVQLDWGFGVSCVTKEAGTVLEGK